MGHHAGWAVTTFPSCSRAGAEEHRRPSWSASSHSSPFPVCTDWRRHGVWPRGNKEGDEGIMSQALLPDPPDTWMRLLPFPSRYGDRCGALSSLFPKQNLGWKGWPELWAMLVTTKVGRSWPGYGQCDLGQADQSPRTRVPFYKAKGQKVDRRKSSSGHLWWVASEDTGVREPA